jgi:hypothetical protein
MEKHRQQMRLEQDKFRHQRRTETLAVDPYPVTGRAIGASRRVD